MLKLRGTFPRAVHASVEVPTLGDELVEKLVLKGSLFFFSHVVALFECLLLGLLCAALLQQVLENFDTSLDISSVNQEDAVLVGNAFGLVFQSA